MIARDEKAGCQANRMQSALGQGGQGFTLTDNGFTISSSYAIRGGGLGCYPGTGVDGGREGRSEYNGQSQTDASISSSTSSDLKCQTAS